MVHKSSFIPGISRFVDESVLSHYPPTSMKRILMAGAVSLYLKQNEGMIDSIISNPLFAGLGVATNDGMVDVDKLRDVLHSEVSKAGFMRLSIPFVGDIDFTADDVNTLHKFITEANTTSTPKPELSHTPYINNTGVY
jgi:hypothetical protein